MNTGRQFVAVDVPCTVMFLKPTMPMRLVGTCAVKSTTQLMLLPDLVTVAVTFDNIAFAWALSCPRNIFLASVTQALTVLSPDMIAAAASAGEDIATEPTLAASAAASIWLRSFNAIV